MVKTPTNSRTGGRESSKTARIQVKNRSGKGFDRGQEVKVKFSTKK